MYVKLSNSSVATITDISFPSWATINNTSAMDSLKSGGSVRISAVDLKEAIKPGCKNVTLATLTISGNEIGSTDVAFDKVRIDSDSGSSVKPTPLSGSIKVQQNLFAIGFTADVRMGAAPLTVNFKDFTKGQPTSWAWDFNNDGVIDSTLQNPNYTYTAPGNYTVKLTVSNDGGSASATKTDYIRVTNKTQGVVEAFPEQTKLPTDPNKDGLYEDINGNGRLDFNDVVEFFKHMDWVKNNTNVGTAPYDFNKNGKVDFDDVVMLYQMVMG